MGARWLANIDRFESMIAPVGRALLARADYREGENVIDIGCGGGTTSLAIAAAVGVAGSVVGVDISPDLTATATERARAAGVTNVRFVCADAACYQPEKPFDRLCSRFGSMFFTAPGAAFANLHRCVQLGGQIDLAVWGPPRENPWMMEMMGVLRRHIEVPQAVPRTPGPFAFEDVDYLRTVLSGGGFSGIDIVAYSGLQPVGGAGASPQDAVNFAMTSLAAGRLLQDSPSDLRGRVEDDLLALFTRHYQPGEGVLMTGKAWLVSAIA
jgi:SAM-dependent methyltransferase